MRVLRFLQQYVFVAILGVIAVALFAFDMVGRAEQLINWGVPGWVYEVAGILFMFAAMAVLVFQLHSRIEAFEAKSANEPRNPVTPPKDIAAQFKKFGGPNYAEWDGVVRLTLVQAAHLWSEMTPPINPGPQHRTPTGRILTLQQAIQDGRLAAHIGLPSTRATGSRRASSRSALSPLSRGFSTLWPLSATVVSAAAGPAVWSRAAVAAPPSQPPSTSAAPASKAAIPAQFKVFPIVPALP